MAALLVVTIWMSANYMLRMPEASTQDQPRPLRETQVEPSWILSGKPVFKFAEFFKSPDGRSISGIWSCEGPASFEWHFRADETVHILEGRVEIDYQGRRLVLEPNDTATFHEGTRAIWHVPEYIKKSYTLQHPNRVVRSMRRLADWLGLR